MHRVKGQVLRDITNYFSAMELNDPLTVELPVDGSAPVEGLRVLHGFSCAQCRFLTTARDNIVRHWRTANHEVGEERWTRVRLQSWVWLQRRFTRYWIVDVAATMPTGPEDRRTNVSAIDRMISEFEAELEVEAGERLRKGDLKEGMERESAWVKWIGWAKHFGVRDLLDIQAAAEWVRGREAQSRRADEDEAATAERLSLVRLGESFDREIERCCWRLESVPTETLQWLASILPTAPNGMPFGRKGMEASMTKYCSIGHRYLGFCARAHRLGRKDAFEKLAVTFTDEQWSLLGDVMYELGNTTRSSSDDSGFFSGDGSEPGSGEDEDRAGEELDETAVQRQENAALDRSVFLYLVRSVKQHIGGNAYGNPLLSFCAALGVVKRPLGYSEPHLYTGMLAGMLWWARLLLLESTFEGQTRELAEVGVDKVLEFRDEHAKWMCVGTHSVMSTIIGWMAYGKGYRKKMGGQPSIRWHEGGSALFHSGERIDVADFKRTFRDLAGEAEDWLDQLMAGTWARVSETLDMGRLADSLVRMGAGNSFATDPKNKWLEPGPGKVMRLSGSALWDGGRNRWKYAAARKWLRRLTLFREALMVLVHVWGGQPGRGPELTTLRHCDSWQLIRNVFVLDGQVMVVTDRDKTKSIRDNSRKVARFLPDRIGRMVIAYIAWLIPSERMLCRKCKLPGPPDELVEFMWRDGRPGLWDTDRLSRVMGRVTQAGTGVHLSVARYRPVAIEMGRRIRGLVMRQLDTQLDDEGNEDENVDVDPATGEPVDCGGSWDILWDLQATHGTRIARQHYAVNVSYPGKLQPELIASYREISRLWHQFLEHEGEADRGTKRKGGGRGAVEDFLRGRPSKFAKTKTAADGSGAGDVEAEMAAGLQKLLGPLAAWRSEKQGESMRTVMSLGSGHSAISVLPTGAGKSILFMLPAVMTDTGTSIVVVPYVALMEDLVRRAVTMGVDCIRFRTTPGAGREGLARAARLVVVSADVVAGAEFTAYADGLAAAGLLGRIFVDECHTAIMDIGYRSRLGELASLHRYGCPLVLLTATLPVVLEDWFRKQMLAQGAVIVRDRTTKLNCRYGVEQVQAGKGAVEQRTVETVRRLGRRMTGKQKGVIYCRSKKQCEDLAGELGCDFHHSDMTEQRRREAREAWAAGGGHRWITATTGLGTGVDIEGIVAVVHMGQPYGLVDFIQQTGRGGRRRGEVVESVVVHDGRPARVDVHRSFVDDNNQSQMSAFVSTPGCRRAVIAAFMDGVAGETCSGLAGGEACDNCLEEARAAEEQEQERQVGSGGRIWRVFREEEGRRVRALLRWLDEVGEECAVCHVRRYQRGLELEGVPEGRPHRGDRKWCKVVGEEEYAQVRRTLTFGDLSCCYICKLPLDWCEELRQRRGEGECAYMDKVLPVVLMAVRSLRLKKLTKELFQVDPDEKETFFTWLGRNRRFHGMNGTNALAVWEEMIWEVYKGGRYWF